MVCPFLSPSNTDTRATPTPLPCPPLPRRTVSARRPREPECGRRWLPSGGLYSPALSVSHTPSAFTLVAASALLATPRVSPTEPGGAGCMHTYPAHVHTPTVHHCNRRPPPQWPARCSPVWYVAHHLRTNPTSPLTSIVVPSPPAISYSVEEAETPKREAWRPLLRSPTLCRLPGPAPAAWHMHRRQSPPPPLTVPLIVAFGASTPPTRKGQSRFGEVRTSQVVRARCLLLLASWPRTLLVRPTAGQQTAPLGAVGGR